MFSYLSTLPLADVGYMINSAGNWFQSHIGVTTIRTLGVVATVYGFIMVFRAATSRQGQGTGRWLQAGIALVVGFGMIVAPTFYNNIGYNTNDSVQHAVNDGGQAGVNTAQTVTLGNQLVKMPEANVGK